MNVARPLRRCSVDAALFLHTGYPDQEIGDPHGVIAPSDETAIETARKVIDELLAERGPEDPNPTIVVENEVGEVIYRFPGN